VGDRALLLNDEEKSVVTFLPTGVSVIKFLLHHRNSGQIIRRLKPTRVDHLTMPPQSNSRSMTLTKNIGIGRKSSPLTQAKLSLFNLT